MKIIKIFYLSLLALVLIASAGILIFFQIFDTDQYLPQITKKASFALGRPVTVGHLGLGLSLRGITLDAGPLSVADDPGFTTQPFIQVGRVRISLDWGALIIRQEFHITDILLQSPQIHLIRSQEGLFNIQSLGSASPSSVDSTVRSTPIKNEGVSPFSNGDISRKIGTSPSFRSIKIQDASISFIDQNHAIPLDIWLNAINASLRPLSLILTDRRSEGRAVGPEGLNGFSLSRPFHLSIDGCFYNDAPNVHASADVFWDMSKRSILIRDLKLLMDLSRLDIDGLKGISPDISHSSLVKNTAGVVQLNMARLEMGDPEGLEANGGISTTGGVIKNFNVIQTLFSHTLGVFGPLQRNIDNLLEGPLKNSLGPKDTVIEKAQAQFSIHNKTVFIDDSLVQTNIFEFKAKGSVDQGLNMDMQTTLALNGDISATLINEFKGLEYLTDDSKRIAIGASLKGVIPHLKYKPNKDFRKKSKRALMAEGGNILGALLKGGQISSQDQDTPSQDSGPKAQNSFKNIFKSLLP